MNNLYSDAFAEVLFIINCLPKNEQLKISNDFIDMLKYNMNKDYEVNINPNYNLASQPILDETKAILKQLYLEFFANDLEKDAIALRESLAKNIEENNKIGVESLFNDIKDFDIEPTNLPTTYEGYTSNIFARFKKWFMALFKK